MKLIFSIISCLFAISAAHAEAPAAKGTVAYKLKWNVDKSFDFEIRTFELPSAYSTKVGTNGTIIDTMQLRPVQEFKNNEILVGPKKTVLIGLVIKSRSGKKADFFVSPHQTDPAVGSLDFKFSCLCYHHVYHLEAKKMWFRVMSLSNRAEMAEIKNYTLTHDIIPWEGELPADPSKEEHHH